MRVKWAGLAALVAVACLVVRGDVAAPKRIAKSHSADNVVGEDIYITDFDVVEVNMSHTIFEAELWTEVQVPRMLRFVVSPRFLGNPLDPPFFDEFWLYCDEQYPITAADNRQLKRYRFKIEFPYRVWQGYPVLVDDEGQVTSWTVPVSAYTTN